MNFNLIKNREVMMNVIFCGGGTSGHVTPAIAIAEQMLKSSKDIKIAFIGRLGGGENALVKNAGFKLYSIEIEGLKRSLSLTNIKRLCLAFSAKKKAKSIISDFKADVVVGMGGYVSWPVLEAARSIKIPTVIHESNSVPGLVSKLFAKKADLVLLGCPTCEGDLKSLKNAKLSGNPVRGEFGKIKKSEARRRLRISDNEFMIFSVGGSGGAETVNKVIMEVINSFSIKKGCVRHIHSSGKRYFEKLSENYTRLCSSGERGCRVYPFISDMATYITAADLVISRCGAMTLSEIALCGTPPILIPSPNVTGNHQVKNAEHFSENRAAVVVEEKELNCERLMFEIEKLMKNDALRTEMSENLKKLSSPRSAEVITAEILRIAEQKL